MQVHLKQQDDGIVHYCIIARGSGCSTTEDAAALRNFFTLDTKLSEVGKAWSQDARYRAVAPYFQGVHCLRRTVCSWSVQDISEKQRLTASVLRNGAMP